MLIGFRLKVLLNVLSEFIDPKPVSFFVYMQAVGRQLFTHSIAVLLLEKRKQVDECYLLFCGKFL